MADRPAGSVRKQLFDKRVCICAGPGGVGKTTVSAALALAIAAEGRRVAVVTIDPARRLAEALGIADEQAHSDAAAGIPVRIGPELLQRTGMEVSGELWALTLDVPATFDRLLSELAPSERARDAVAANRIYRELRAALAGSQEIAAVAELYDLHRRHRLDAIVLDTPPASDALQFFQAPGRLAAFLNSRAISIFMSAGTTETDQAADSAQAGSLRGRLSRSLPRAIGARALGGGSALLLAIFAKATGIDMVGEVAGFMRILAAARRPLRERALAVQALLRDPQTATLLITSPESEPLRETIELHEKLAEMAMHCAGVAVNRVHQPLIDEYDPQRLLERLEGTLGQALASRLVANLHDFESLARREQRSVEDLAATLCGTSVLTIPMLGGEVEDLARLGEVARALQG